MVSMKFISLCLLGTALSVNALNVTDISECPALAPREAPTNVRDLRPDDIKIIGALGDSITAGFAIMGYSTTLPPLLATFSSYYEYRGLSYSIGGDTNASTIPNFVKHYQENVTGYSTGKHLGEYCNGFNCYGIYQPRKDQLNAAQSGAIAMNLDHELNYLIPRMKSLAGDNFETDWKMINIQIGSNDMCGACNSSYMAEVTADKYGDYVEAAIERIQANIPRVLINLIGTFNVSQVFPLTEGNPYCQRASKKSSSEEGSDSCSCSTSEEGLAKMDELSTAYNEKLYNIYQKHQANQTDDFAVVYQQSNINITGFPVDFFSDLDCFHPSLKGHRWVSKIIWNQLFSNQETKPRVFNFNANETIYCPVDSDRIVVN